MNITYEFEKEEGRWYGWIIFRKKNSNGNICTSSDSLFVVMQRMIKLVQQGAI